MTLISQFAGGSTGLRRRRAQIESGYGIQRPVGMGSTGGLRSTENIRVVISCAALNPRVMPGCTTGLIGQTANTACPGLSSARPACKTFASVSVPTKPTNDVSKATFTAEAGSWMVVRDGILEAEAKSRVALSAQGVSRGGRNSITLVPKSGASRRKGQTAYPSTQAYDAANAVARNLCRPAAILRMK